MTIERVKKISENVSLEKPLELCASFCFVVIYFDSKDASKMGTMVDNAYILYAKLCLAFKTIPQHQKTKMRSNIEK